jgi:hypothetical protein
MLALVSYFAFRMVVEWFQCEASRRQLVASQLDFWAAHLISIIAVSIYFVQATSPIRVGRYLTAPAGLRVLAAVAGGVAWTFGSLRVWRFERARLRAQERGGYDESDELRAPSGTWCITLAVTGATVACVAVGQFRSWRMLAASIGAILGFALVVIYTGLERSVHRLSVLGMRAMREGDAEKPASDV